MNKKVKADRKGESDGHNYFENLPDELVIYIFTIVSSSESESLFFFEGSESLDDNIISLGRLSSVSKRFNSLTALVTTLSIRHANIEVLYKHCPKILEKFKHIRSLEIGHFSRPEIEMHRQGKPLPIIWWEAAYRPHAYCLAVVSYKKIYPYSDDSQKQQSIMLSADTAAKDDEYNELIRHHAMDMIYLHHKLFSMIKDHNYLQRVVVTDLGNRGTLTLEEDTLAELRNCASTNLEQVLAHYTSGFNINLNVPHVKTGSGLLMTNTCFNIVEWWENATDDQISKSGDDDDVVVPNGLPFECPKAQILKDILAGVMENPDDVKVNDGKAVLDILSDIKSEGYLF